MTDEQAPKRDEQSEYDSDVTSGLAATSGGVLEQRGQEADESSSPEVDDGTVAMAKPLKPEGSVDAGVGQEAAAGQSSEATSISSSQEAIAASEAHETSEAIREVGRSSLMGRLDSLRASGAEKLCAFATSKNMLALTAICAILLIAFICSASSCSTMRTARLAAEKSASDYKTEVETLEEEKRVLQAEVDTLEGEVNELKNGASALLVKIKNAFEAGDWQGVVTLYDRLHQAYNGSPEDAEAKGLADQAQAKIDEARAAEEKKKAEEEAAKKAEEERKAQEAAAEEQRKAEEAAKAYDTGITYEQVARDPEGYTGDKLTFTGKVLQVQRSDYSTVIRLAVDSDYDQVVLCSYMDSATPTRVLENDIITVKAVVIGETSYTSVLGATITLPEIYADEVMIQ